MRLSFTTSFVLASLFASVFGHQGQSARKIHKSRNESSLSARAEFDNARFTYYVDGPDAGACGTYNQPFDLVVAMNIPQFGNGEHCYAMVTLFYEGQTLTAQVVDRCEICPYGGLDLSQGSFAALLPGVDVSQFGVLTGSWQFNADVAATTTTTTMAPTSTWVAPTTSSTPPTATTTTAVTSSSSVPSAAASGASGNAQAEHGALAQFNAAILGFGSIITA